MSEWGLAIDYGTSYTVAAIAHDGRVELVEVEDTRRFPSGVLAEDGALLVGRVALSQARRSPDRFEANPKRLVGQPAALLGGAIVAVVDMVAAVLRHLGDAASVRQGGSRPAWVRLTHPASWSGERQGVLREAARRAGLGEVELLSEPEAAAWYFVQDRRGSEQEVRPGRSVAVYDLGGGTFDTAVLRRGKDGFVLAGPPGGDDWFGGENLDERLVERVLARVYERDPEAWRELKQPSSPRWERARLQLREDVRQVKEALSTLPSATVPVDVGDEVLDVEVTRNEFEELIRSDLDRTVEILDGTARSAGVAHDDIAAVYLTGGSSRVPLVAAVVSAYHPNTYTRPDPKTLVAVGALASRPVQPVPPPAAEEQPPASPVSAKPAPGASLQPPAPTEQPRAPSEQPPAPSDQPPRPPRKPGKRRRRLSAPARFAALPRGLLAGLGASVLILLAGIAAITLGGSSSGDGKDPDGAGASSDVRKRAIAYDYDGDKRQELSVGMPTWRAKGSPAAGAVMIMRGARKSPLVMHQGSPGVPGDPQRFAQLGWAVASADFDRDGYADLAVGAPGYDAAPAAGREGAVTVLPGSKKRFSQEGRLLTGPESKGGGNARYGESLATGDLNEDGFPDLVVGVPGDGARQGVRGSGAIRVLFGGEDGLDADRSRRLRRARSRDAAFGSLVAVGDVDRDGNPDVLEAAAGVPVGLQNATVPGHGSYCPGKPGGPAVCRPMGGGPAGGPTALAVGEVTGDRFPDVVHGVGVNAYVDTLAAVPAGAVDVWPGTRRGPSRERNRITQQDDGLVGNDQPADRFGSAIVLGDLDGDRRADLVVGAPGEDFGAGRVTVVPGSASGLRLADGRALSQEHTGVPGTKSPGHSFGAALSLLDTTADGHPELAVTAPGEFRSSGGLIVFRGGREGLRMTEARRVRVVRRGNRSRGTATTVSLGR